MKSLVQGRLWQFCIIFNRSRILSTVFRGLKACLVRQLMKWEAEIAAFLQTKGISVMEDSVVAKRWYWWGKTLEWFYDLYSPPYLWQYPFSEDETGNMPLRHIYLFSLCSSFRNSAKAHENNNLRQQEEEDRAALNLPRALLAALSVLSRECLVAASHLCSSSARTASLVQYNVPFIHYLLFDLIDMTCIFTLYSLLRTGAEKTKLPGWSLWWERG